MSRSGQTNNKGKFALFFSNRISSLRKRGMSPLTGFVEEFFPTIYLGTPLSLGRLKARMLKGLVQKIKCKIANWKEKLLSQGGHLILL